MWGCLCRCGVCGGEGCIGVVCMGVCVGVVCVGERGA